MQDVSIRRIRMEDVPAFTAAVRESLSNLHPWMEWAIPDYGEAQAVEWFEHQLTAWDSGSEYNFLVIDGTDQILGTCGINQINSQHRFANLGYWIRSSATGSGIAVQAVRHLKEWVFTNTNLERLEIVVAQGNTRSERVAEKAGAVREGLLMKRLLIRGVFQDATMFSLVRSPAA